MVTGANGKPGQAVVRNLARRRRAAQSVRDVRKAASLAALGVDVRAGDFDDPASLKAAFAGAEQVLVVSADKLGEEARRFHRNAIGAARNAGARRIRYTSHMGARPDVTFAPAGQHADTEADLAASGVAFTALRHGFYAESCLDVIDHDIRASELRTPEDGPVSWTARADIAV